MRERGVRSGYDKNFARGVSPFYFNFSQVLERTRERGPALVARVTCACRGVSRVVCALWSRSGVVQCAYWACLFDVQHDDWREHHGEEREQARISSATAYRCATVLSSEY